AILHVVRCFTAPEVAHVEGSIDPVRDIDTVETELMLADLEVVTTALEKARRTARGGEREAVARADAYAKAEASLGEGRPVRQLELTPEEMKHLKGLGLITARKTPYVANVDESDIHGEGGMAHKVLEKSFIKAEVYTLDDLVKHKTEAAIKAAGRLRLEGKEYVMRDGDVVHFQAGLAGRR